MDKTISKWFHFVVLIMAFGCYCRGQIDLEPIDVPWENEPWTLQCSVNSINSVVTFFNPGDTTAGNCEPSGILPATCTESIGNTLTINETADSVFLTRTITNADTGTWKCTHSTNTKPYDLSSPLPSRILPSTLTSYSTHSMTATAGSELTPDTVHSFTFHYGCVSSNLKFVWATVPGSSSSDTSNPNSNSLTCTSNSAYMSTLATSAAILQSVAAKETKLKVSVYLDGYENLVVEEYTYNVTFSPGKQTKEKSDTKAKEIGGGTTAGVVVSGGAGCGIWVIFLMLSIIPYQVYVIRGQKLILGMDLPDNCKDVSWEFKENTIIQPSGKQLILENAQDEDEGEYVCEYSIDQKKFTLKINVFVIDCMKTVIKDKKLPKDRVLSSSFGSFDVKRMYRESSSEKEYLNLNEYLSQKDGGLYICECEENKSKARVEVKQLKLLLNIVDSESKVTEGAEVQLVKQFKFQRQNKVVRWTLNGQPWFKETFNAKPEYQGIYMCEWFTKVKKKVIRQIKVNLVVTKGNSVKKDGIDDVSTTNSSTGNSSTLPYSVDIESETKISFKSPKLKPLDQKSPVTNDKGQLSKPLLPNIPESERKKQETHNQE